MIMALALPVHHELEVTFWAMATFELWVTFLDYGSNFGLRIREKEINQDPPQCLQKVFSPYTQKKELEILQ